MKRAHHIDLKAQKNDTIVMVSTEMRSSSSHLQGDLPSAGTLITHIIKTLSFDLKKAPALDASEYYR